jgi:hypothetical protein
MIKKLGTYPYLITIFIEIEPDSSVLLHSESFILNQCYFDLKFIKTMFSLISVTRSCISHLISYLALLNKSQKRHQDIFYNTPKILIIHLLNLYIYNYSYFNIDDKLI